MTARLPHRTCRGGRSLPFFHRPLLAHATSTRRQRIRTTHAACARATRDARAQLVPSRLGPRAQTSLWSRCCHRSSDVHVLQHAAELSDVHRELAVRQPGTHVLTLLLDLLRELRPGPRDLGCDRACVRARAATGLLLYYVDASLVARGAAHLASRVSRVSSRVAGALSRRTQ